MLNRAVMYSLIKLLEGVFTNMAELENQELQRNEESVGSADYIDAINGLKQELAQTAKKNEALEAEARKLRNQFLNGMPVETQAQVQKEDIQTLRNKVFNNPDQTNLEYITNALNLRNRLLEEGYEDPFVPQGTQISATQADYDRANKVANVLQEMVDEADGDSNVFLNEYQRRVKDTSIKKK